MRVPISPPHEGPINTIQKYGRALGLGSTVPDLRCRNAGSRWPRLPVLIDIVKYHMSGMLASAAVTGTNKCSNWGCYWVSFFFFFYPFITEGPNMIHRSCHPQEENKKVRGNVDQVAHREGGMYRRSCLVDILGANRCGNQSQRALGNPALPWHHSSQCPINASQALMVVSRQPSASFWANPCSKCKSWFRPTRP